MQIRQWSHLVPELIILWCTLNQEIKCVILGCQILVVSFSPNPTRLSPQPIAEAGHYRPVLTFLIPHTLNIVCKWSSRHFETHLAPSGRWRAPFIPAGSGQLPYVQTCYSALCFTLEAGNQKKGNLAGLESGYCGDINAAKPTRRMRIKSISAGEQLLTITLLRVLNGLSMSCEAAAAGRESRLCPSPSLGINGREPEEPQKEKEGKAGWGSKHEFYFQRVLKRGRRNCFFCFF